MYFIVLNVSLMKKFREDERRTSVSSNGKTELHFSVLTLFYCKDQNSQKKGTIIFIE